MLIATHRMNAKTAGPNSKWTRFPSLTSITRNASSITSIMLHLPTCSMMCSVVALCRLCRNSSRLSSSSSTIFVSGKTIENRSTTPPTSQLPRFRSSRVPRRMLDCCRIPNFSISRIGHNTAGQNNTNVATAAAAVRLAVVRRQPG